MISKRSANVAIGTALLVIIALVVVALILLGSRQQDGQSAAAPTVQPSAAIVSDDLPEPTASTVVGSVVEAAELLEDVEQPAVAPAADVAVATDTPPPTAEATATAEPTAEATQVELPESASTVAYRSESAATLAAAAALQNIEYSSVDVISETQALLTGNALPTLRPTVTPNTPQIIARSDAALFSAAGGGDGRIGFFVPQDQHAWVYGRSDDMRWLHVRTRIAAEGWVSASLVDLLGIRMSDLPISDYRWTPPPNVTPYYLLTATPTSTPQWIAANPTPRPWATATPRPASTPWPTATPRLAQPATPRPAQPATTTPRPPIVVAQPTPRPSSGPTATPTGTWPTATAIWMVPTSPAGNDGPPAETGAIAWWHADETSRRSTGGGRWAVDIVVRVPTAFQYLFDAQYLSGTQLSERNNDGDDYYSLRLSGMLCGQNYSGSLTVRQNGLVMIVFNEYTLTRSMMAINAPC